LKDDVHSQFGNAEISNAVFTVADDVSIPVVISYTLKVQNYAQRTGKRLFLAPSLFETAKQARFTAGTRHFPVYFEFPWSEFDHVEIVLPKGYELDHPDAPATFNFPPIGSYGVKLAISKDNKLVFDRKLVFGTNEGMLLFSPDVYPQMKKIFDAVHEADSHMLTLKVAQPAVSTAGAGN
jgi:hypothetical protein